MKTEYGNRPTLHVSETDGRIVKYRGVTKFSYTVEDYDEYLKSYDGFEPDERMVKILLVGRKYINVSEGRPYRGSSAVFIPSDNCISTNSGILGTIPVKDFVFNLLSPNPEWREVFPGEIGSF